MEEINEFNDLQPALGEQGGKIKKGRRPTARATSENTGELTSCLRNKRVIVRFVPKDTGLVTDPHHVLYGGMAMNAKRTYCVPRLQSGAYKNVLTQAEQEFLESYLGFERNDLSIYKKEHNYWEGKSVTLTKQDNYLDLSNPDDYIRYKILLANDEYIAPNLSEMELHPLATYDYVIIENDDEEERGGSKMDVTRDCYIEFGKHETDLHFLKTLVEILEGRPLGDRVTINGMKNKCNSLIQANPKKFLKEIRDELLPMKILIRRGVSAGVLSMRGTYYYLRSDGSPLCGDNEQPTLNQAAYYISLAKNQGIRFAIEAAVDKE